MICTVLIADDHDIIRAGIKDILSSQEHFKVIGEASDGEEAIKKAGKHKPDILLLDISMPKITGLDAIKQIKVRSPETNIIIITVHKTNAYIIKAFSEGVKGYLQKGNAGEELLPALNKVASGDMYLTPEVSTYLVDKAVKKAQKRVTDDAFFTAREKEILRLVSDGDSAKEIAAKLFISKRTVENYKNNLLKKLGFHKTNELIKYAIKHGIADIEEY